MKNLIGVISSLFILLTLGCGQPDIHNFFDEEHSEEEINRFIEKFSADHWSTDFDYAIKAPRVKHRVDSIKEKFGLKVYDIHYMYDRYGEPKDHDIWLIEYGKHQSLVHWYEPGGKIRELKCIPTCILEMFQWQVESGEYVEVVFLRTGKELIPYHGWWFPADYIFPE